MTVHHKPEGMPDVCAYLTLRGVARIVPFLEVTFGATLLEANTEHDGTVRHCTMRIGDSVVMMGEAWEDQPTTPGQLYVYVRDTDATYTRALAQGATSVMAPANQFYGDRNAGVKDASGNTWWIATHLEDVSPEEMARRVAARKR